MALLALSALLFLPSACAAAARVLVWAPPGTPPTVINCTLTAVLTGSGSDATSVLFVSDAAALETALAATSLEWLVVPSFVSLPLGRYWGVGDNLSSVMLEGAAPPPPAAAALASFLARGGKWLVAPGSRPTGWFNDLPPSLFAINVFSPYEVYNHERAFVGELDGVRVVSALPFPSVGTAAFSPSTHALDARNRTLAWASSTTRFVSGPFASSCWVVSGVVDEAAYGAPSWGRELTGLVATCSQPPSPPPPPPPPACPCAPRGSPASPLLPRLSINNSFFVRPDGAPFLAIGADIFRDHAVGLSAPSAAALIRTARASGANVIRLYGWSTGTPEWACALDCATAEGVYLLPTVDGHVSGDYTDLASLRAHALAFASAVVNETVLLGVDGVNEPYTWEVGALRLNASTTMTLAERFHLNLSEYSAFEAALNPGAFSTFPNLVDGVIHPPSPAHAPFLVSLDAMWGAFTREGYADAFAAAAPATPLCIGFNHWEALLPSVHTPGGVAFTCSHAYTDSGRGFADAQSAPFVPSLLDRLAANGRAPGARGRPVLLGETGSSNGAPATADAMGGRLNADTAAIVDSLPHLFSLAHAHSGALRWAVTDVPLPYAVQGMPWLGNASDPANTARYASEGRFGVAWWDGVAEGGILKPTAIGLAAIRALLDELLSAGVLASAGAAWSGWGDVMLSAAGSSWDVVYDAPGALIVGAHGGWEGAALAFAPPGAALVVVRWGVVRADTTRVCLVATRDIAGVRLRPVAFVAGARVGGGGGAWVSIDLWRGEEACVEGG